MRALPIVIERHEHRARRRARVTYRLRQGRLMLASAASTREGAEALAFDLARLLRVCVFHRPGGEGGPAALIPDHTHR
jgi:hypothetical protein